MEGVGKSYSLGEGAALLRTGVALGGAVGGSDCNEGSDGEQAREADEHLFSDRVGEFDCSRCDGILFC